MRLAGLAVALALAGAQPTQVVIKSCVYPIRQYVHFEPGSARVGAESKPLLEEVVATLQANPDVRRLQLEGHTDSSEASGKQALALSERRAQAVRDALVALGVASSRLVVLGSGSSKPLAPNQTAQGRAQNRRVEFNVLERQGAP